ncbi:hypothetical protein AVEN_203487-1 [Araneus ventricosus]|uniref:Uncharacterized protein n=1 Tax=Araneus ventricosus TaxID=182803 RepID=A0A4Y2BIW5_ARAVE|nr:hypothetical protein AVEN_203487-1 [Araneus ventricosus]
MTLLWLIPFCAEKRQVHFVGLLAIAASTCVDVLSCVAVFGLSDLFALATKPVHFEFPDKFCLGVMGYLLSVHCIESTRYITGGTTPSQQNNVNPFYLR